MTKAKTTIKTARKITARDIERQAHEIWRQIGLMQQARLAWDDDGVVKASDKLWRYIDRAYTSALSQACRRAIDIDFRMASESHGIEAFVIVSYETEAEWKARCKVKRETKPTARKRSGRRTSETSAPTHA